MITADVFSSAGGRENNEDYAGYRTAGDYGVFLVADGLGGHKDGEVASRLAVETGLEMFCANPQIDSSNLVALFKTANEKILGQQADSRGMKTTLTGLYLKGETAVWAHIGDTRLYYFADGCLAFQTKDHSVSRLAVEVGEIPPEKIRFHPDRSKLLKVLGDKGDVMPEISEAIGLKPGESFLLCTDGFWEYVYETEMEIDLAKSRTPEDWLRLMASRHYARESGDCDNYTALAVFIR